MPTRLVQNESQAAGTAAFQVSGPVAAQVLAVESLEIAIIQPGPTERYLDARNPDDPWTTSVYRFRPLTPRREGSALWLDIDYGVSYHLRANQPYKLRLREAGGAEAEEVFTVPATLRRPAAKPRGWTPPPDPRGPLTAPQAAAEPAPTAPAPKPEPEPVPPPPSAPTSAPTPAPEPVNAGPDAPLFTSPPVPTPAPPSGKKWLLPALLLLGLGGGAAAWFLLSGKADSSGGLQTMDACRSAVAAAPEAAAARLQADALSQQNKLLDCQFLLYKYAGEKGDRDAARVLGTYYDPDTWSKDKSPLPAPNPTEAARWHKQAAEAGDAQSQFRYGMLLKLGRTDASDGPEQAQVWLRKSADQGFALAKEELAR